MPRLEQAIIGHLGRCTASASWLRDDDDAVAHSQVVQFEYPMASKAGFNRLRREVKLELGSLTDQRPTEQHAVRPWVVEDFSATFSDWQCRATTLELARTFWEKATILHAEHHRPADQATLDRCAKHCVDVERLLHQPEAAATLADQALCEGVVGWKSRVFAPQWARFMMRVTRPADQDGDAGTRAGTSLHRSLETQVTQCLARAFFLLADSQTKCDTFFNKGGEPA